MSVGGYGVPRSEFEALLERSRIAAPSHAERKHAQAFWEGELLPTPVVGTAEDE
jgi:hypothetical protein